MKNYFNFLFTLVCIALSIGAHAQIIQTPFNRSTIHWDTDITITDVTKATLQNANIESRNKITISSPAAVDLTNTNITCKEIEFRSGTVTMNNVTITCEKIKFTNTLVAFVINKMAKINARNIEFDAVAAGAPNTITITNSGSGELTIIGNVNPNNRNLTFKQLENFKVSFEN